MKSPADSETNAAPSMIDVSRSADAIWVRLCRPAKLNALDYQGWVDLADALESAASAAPSRPVVITGEGRAFCAGDDVSEFLGMTADRDWAVSFLLGGLFRAFTAIIEHPAPVLAAVNGLAFGGGCEIVTVADIVVAVRDAQFALPEGRIGAFPAIVAGAAGAVGARGISRYAFTGEPFCADEALRLGIVDELVDPEALEATVGLIAAQIARSSPEAVVATKKHLNASRRQALPGMRDALLTLIDEILPSANMLEGARAFTEKRRPAFSPRP